MKRIFLPFLLFVLLPLSADAQSTDLSYLVVRGSAEVQVPVDYLEVTITITSYAPTLAAANDTNRAIVFELFQTLRQFSIPDSAFQTQTNSSGENYVPREPERRFSVRYSGVLHLTRPSMYDSLFRALLNIGNLTVNISWFGSTRYAYYKMLAYQKAVDAARREAQMMLKGTKQSVGKIIKLIQDNRDVFTQYDNPENLLQEAVPPNVITAPITAERANPPSTYRKKYYSEVGQVTVIFELK